MSTVPKTEPRPIPSDATLVWLASERAAPLFRTLDRTRAFGPLVVLLATLPALLATYGESVTADDAAWGLRALDATGAEMPPELAAEVEDRVPASSVRVVPLWLSAALMRSAGPAAPVSGSLASLVGGVLLLGAFWPLAKRLSGRRLAFWAVVLAAFHPPIAELLRFPAPVNLGVAASVAALWGSMSLEGKATGLLAWAATAAAVAVGLTIAGPVGLAVPAVIVIDVILALGSPARAPALRPSSRGLPSPTRLAVRRVSAALAGTAVWAVGEALGPGFEAAARPAAAPPDPVEIDGALAVGPLWGLAAIGVGRLLRVMQRRAASRSPRPIPRLIVVWLVAAGAAMLGHDGAAAGGFDPAGRYVLAFAALPVLLAAAYAIEEASRRAVSGAWVLLAVALPLAVRFGTYMATYRADEPLGWLLLGGVALAVFWLAAKAVPAAVPMPGLRRGMLMAAILAAVAADAGDGLSGLLTRDPDAEAYRRLTARLAAAEPPRTVVLVANAPPLDLGFALRASYPNAAMKISATWDSAAAMLAGGLPPDPTAVVVAWQSRAGIGGLADDLYATGEPLLFADHELLVYKTRAEK